MKQCSRCGELRDLSSYTKDRTHKDGLTSQCQPCRSEGRRTRRLSDYQLRQRDIRSSATWRERNPDKAKHGVRDATLRKKYGIDVAGYNLLFESQDKRCAICLSDVPRGSKYFHVDHDHVTGQIRGILCQACNVTLGKMNDNPTLLRNAAAYLEKYDRK